MRKIKSSAERYRAFLLFANARAWTILNAKVSRQTRGQEERIYKLDKLAPNDILYQIYRLREWFLYLTKNEHLQRTDKEKLGKPGLNSVSGYSPSERSLAGICTPSSSHLHPLERLSSSWLVSCLRFRRDGRHWQMLTDVTK
jgi:hypothetical protein